MQKAPEAAKVAMAFFVWKKFLIGNVDLYIHLAHFYFEYYVKASLCLAEASLDSSFQQ